MSAWPDDLEAELQRAEQIARYPGLEKHLAGCRRADEAGFQWLRWGVDFVEFARLTYQPVPDGEPALIVTAVDRSYQPVDLVACAWRGKRIATRCGVATVLGEDELDLTRHFEDRPTLVSNPFLYLFMRACAVCILDWSTAPDVLDGIDSVLCDSRSLAQRVHATTRRMESPPRLFFPQPGPALPQRSPRRA